MRLLALLTLIPKAYADGVPLGPCSTSSGLDNRFQSLCDNSINTPVGTIIGNILAIILVIAAILAVLFIIWGGAKWIMSGGDKAKVDTARTTVVAAIIGLILTFLAFFVMSLLFRIFGLNFQTLSLPTLNEGDTTTCGSSQQYYDSSTGTCHTINAVYCDSINELYDSSTGTCVTSAKH